MNLYLKRYFFVLVMILINCVDPFNPPAITSPNKYLVVDGFINGGEGATSFKLSYTRNLNDTAKSYVKTANVYVEGKSSGAFQLVNLGGGVYLAEHPRLNQSDQYRLHILLNDGKEYYSDYVEVKETPEIDSIGWNHSSDGVNIHVSTHDPNNKTKYYQWDYEETWEFHSAFYSYLKYEKDTFLSRSNEEQIYKCFRSQRSTAIAVGSSEQLSDDIIYKFPLIAVPASYSDKLSVRYSVLVKQYALTQQGFEYWQNLKKITENLGSLFDPQPSTLKGNIYSVKDPTEPVVGYISASTVKEKRIFITRNQYGFGKKVYTGNESCLMDTVPGKGFPPKEFNSSMIPLYIEILPPGGAQQLFVGYSTCVDCRLKGSPVTPDFW